MSASDTALVPYTDILRQECPRLRILVVEKSGAGKSALINAVFGVEGATVVTHRTPGVHDINKPLSFPENDRIIIHDSQGFEGGENSEANIKKVFDFDPRSQRLVTNYMRSVPIIVVFTKLDILREKKEKKLEKELEQRDEDMEDKEFEAELDTAVEEGVQELCVKPLRALSPEYRWVATSTIRQPRFRKTITDLVQLALELTNIEKVWIEMAIAQRLSAKASIDASIRIGRKRYWRGLLSDIFLGFSMRIVLDVLQQDIVNVWSMHDPENHLKKPEFLSLLSVLVEDLSDEAANNYPLTEKAVHAIIDHPSFIIIAGPTAIIVLFAEWVRGTFKKTSVPSVSPLCGASLSHHDDDIRKSSLRCLTAFIIDLTLTMDTLFYLALSRGQPPMKIGLVNQALRIYRGRKAPVHNSIRTWADGLGTFTHLDADVVIKKIAEIIMEHSVKPEQWERREERLDESWMTMDALRDS
ncbi:hypothetical protein DFH09DRAFT_1302183 [Mycena vulgaris]|nr:hypothetical protein DFH09DRAFT_1302183 [Mycena vulgaris]